MELHIRQVAGQYSFVRLGRHTLLQLCYAYMNIHAQSPKKTYEQR